MKKVCLLALCLLLVSDLDTVHIRVSRKKAGITTIGKPQYGIASFYSDQFHGKKTANGEVFSQQRLTAAHNRLPLGTWVRVTNMKNRRSVIVRVNDRMHERNKRIIDLSKAAATQIKLRKAGVARVKVEVIKRPKSTSKR